MAHAERMAELRAPFGGTKRCSRPARGRGWGARVGQPPKICGMARHALSTALALALHLCVSEAKRPHLVFILADDLGWHSVGFREPSLLTPALDALRASGVELSSYYTYKYCSPTRSSLQSGRLPIHVNVLNADMSSYNPQDPVSGFAGM